MLSPSSSFYHCTLDTVTLFVQRMTNLQRYPPTLRVKAKLPLIIHHKESLVLKIFRSCPSSRIISWKTTSLSSFKQGDMKKLSNNRKKLFNRRSIGDLTIFGFTKRSLSGQEGNMSKAQKALQCPSFMLQKEKGFRNFRKA